MAKATSAKKVARVAARSGGKSTAAKQRNWLFPLVIVVIVALGVGLLVWLVPHHRDATSNNTPPRAQLSASKPYDHWHSAFQVSICGKEIPAVNDAQPDTLGIHTHGDGLIHIHPFVSRVAGKGAVISRFFEQTNLKV